MHVIKVKNLKTPAPTAKEMAELRASLGALAGHSDPLTLSLYAPNWLGRQAAHLVYFVGLRTLMDLKELDETKLGPLSWRFFAGGHKTMTTAAGCMTTCGGPGLPPLKVTAVTRGTVPAQMLMSTEMLNDLRELTDSPNNEYELRVLRMPALGTEAFWLKSLTAGLGDMVVPYGTMPGAWNLPKPDSPATLNGNQVYTAAEFLRSAAQGAGQRLAKPDIAALANRPVAQKAPANSAERPSLRWSKPPFSLTGEYWAAHRVAGIGAAKPAKRHPEPEPAKAAPTADHSDAWGNAKAT
jgi:hypothetical protein